MKWVAVFLAMLIVDFFWARWAHHVSNKAVMKAAGYSALIVLCSGFTIMEYTTNPWLLLPAATGGALGTVLAMKT